MFGKLADANNPLSQVLFGLALRFIFPTAGQHDIVIHDLEAIFSREFSWGEKGLTLIVQARMGHRTRSPPGTQVSPSRRSKLSGRRRAGPGRGDEERRIREGRVGSCYFRTGKLFSARVGCWKGSCRRERVLRDSRQPGRRRCTE